VCTYSYLKLIIAQIALGAVNTSRRDKIATNFKEEEEISKARKHPLWPHCVADLFGFIPRGSRSINLKYVLQQQQTVVSVFRSV